MKKALRIIPLFLAVCVMLSSCTEIEAYTKDSENNNTYTYVSSLEDIPEFSNQPYVVINNNVPDFTEDDYTQTSYENYGRLDRLGRCTACTACIGSDLMPTEERDSIGSIKPTGWHTVKYNNIDGKYLYNRCHLIGYQLTAENANEKNLITGTRYLNVTGMLYFEDMVADYIKNTDNHVLYRVTPVFKDDELVARGVHMEGYSVEDNGEGICYNVYCYNAQPGIEIDYATGDSRAVNMDYDFDDGSVIGTYIVNISTKKFHKQNCSGAKKISEENRKTYKGPRESLINNGYEPCKQCNP